MPSLGTRLWTTVASGLFSRPVIPLNHNIDLIASQLFLDVLNPFTKSSSCYSSGLCHMSSAAVASHIVVNNTNPRGAIESDFERVKHGYPTL